MSQQQKNTLTKQELQGFQKAIQEIEKLNKRIKSDGLSKNAFFTGVLNFGLIIFIAGCYPQYYWIFFILKSLIVYPLRLYLGRKQKDNYYLFDFCWISCFSSVILFALIAFNVFDKDTTVQIMRIIFTFSCGIQGWATVIFSNSLVFHSVMYTCSVFIHLTPLVLCYTFRWNLDVISEAFPQYFQLSQDSIATNVWTQLYLPSIGVYLLWSFQYSLWLCTHGLTLPSKGYDTVFNWLYTTKPDARKKIDQIAKNFFGQKPNQPTKVKVLVYMSFHLVVSVIAMLWSLLCYNYQTIHLLFIIFTVISVLWKASSYYNFIILVQPKKKLEAFIKNAQILDEQKTETGNKKEEVKKKYEDKKENDLPELPELERIDSRQIRKVDNEDSENLGLI